MTIPIITNAYVTMLHHSTFQESLKEGVDIHQKLIKNYFYYDVLMTNLIDIYAKFGIIHKAHELFNKNN